MRMTKKNMNNRKNYSIRYKESTNRSYENPPYNSFTRTIICLIFSQVLFFFIVYKLIKCLMLKIYFKRCKEFEKYLNTIIIDKYANNRISHSFFLINNIHMNSQNAVCIFPLKNMAGQVLDVLSDHYHVQEIKNYEFYSRLYFKTMLEYSKAGNRLLYYIKNKKTEIYNNIRSDSVKNDRVVQEQKIRISEVNGGNISKQSEYNSQNTQGHDSDPNHQPENTIHFDTESTSSESINNCCNNIQDNSLDASFLKRKFFDSICLSSFETKYTTIRTAHKLKIFIESQIDNQHRFIICVCAYDHIDMYVYERIANKDIEKLPGYDRVIYNNRSNERPDPNEFSMIYLERTLFMCEFDALRVLVYVLEATCSKANREQIKNFKFEYFE